MRPANVLVDSSIYIELDRAGADPLRALHPLAASYDLVTCGAICCEVGRGVKDPGRRAKFHAIWEAMIYIPSDNRLWRETEDLLWELDRKGKRIPLPDALIAASARRAKAVVLTLDRHFAEIPGLAVFFSLHDL